jgi:hypothetical protein
MDGFDFTGGVVFLGKRRTSNWDCSWISRRWVASMRDVICMLS